MRNTVVKPVVVPGNEILPGTQIDGFVPIVPCNDKTCMEQMAVNILRGLPEALPPRKKLRIIANGPSALDVDLRAIKAHTLALNGSIKLFADQGVAPTYWCACDPQECVADFIPDNPPEETVYLLASKLHPKVFEKLKNRRVEVFHVGDYKVSDKQHIVCAATITLCATWLMHRRSRYSDFEYDGWDGCLLKGKHHASVDEIREEAEVTATWDGIPFPSSKSWLAELQAAQEFFAVAEYFDMNIKINGDGLFAYAFKKSKEKAITEIAVQL